MRIRASFSNMTSRAIVSFIFAASFTNAQLLRGPAVHNNQKPCDLGTEKMYHSEIKYLSGDQHTAGSIYARCWMGKAVCHYEEAIQDKENHKTLPCSEALEIIQTAEHHRNLQIMFNQPWPKSTVCYHPIGPGYTAEEKKEIMDGIIHIEKKTNINFINLNDCNDGDDVCGGCQHGLKFIQGEGCYSAVGYIGHTEQLVSLGSGCFETGGFIVIHELGHAVGLLHEHQHPERNLILLLDNMPPDASANSYAIEQGDVKTAWDPKSVMFYPLMGGNMCVPLKGLDRNQFCDFGERNSPGCTVATEIHCDHKATKRLRQEYVGGLSRGDIVALNQIYPNKSPKAEAKSTRTFRPRCPVSPVIATETNPPFTFRPRRPVSPVV